MTPTNALSPQIAAQLQQLRDIRLPEPVGWWPLAPGWWALIALLCSLMLLIIAWGYLRRRTARHLALKELNKLDTGEAADFAAHVSGLLRRVARRRVRGVDVLTGQAWIDFLCDGKNGLPGDLAGFLAAGPYAGGTTDATTPDLEQLRLGAARWIRRHA